MNEKILKLNLGCGGYRLAGWSNHDRDIDIRRPLPFKDGSVGFVLAEHVIEHVSPREALAFFREIRRILRPGGAIRIVVPCIDLIFERYDEDYSRFLKKRAHNDGSLEAAITSIICNWGHRAIWTTKALQCVLQSLHFQTAIAQPRMSHFREMTNIDGHHLAIGEHANWVESGVVEAVKWLLVSSSGVREYPSWNHTMSIGNKVL